MEDGQNTHNTYSLQLLKMANYLVSTMQTTLKAYMVKATSKEKAIDQVERGLVDPFDEELDELHKEFTHCTELPKQDNK